MKHQFRKFHLFRIFSVTLAAIAVQFMCIHHLAYATFLDKEITLEGGYRIRAAKPSDASTLKPIVMKHVNDFDEEEFADLVKDLTWIPRYQSTFKTNDPDGEHYLFFKDNQLIGGVMLESSDFEQDEFKGVLQAWKVKLPNGVSLQVLMISSFFIRTNLIEEQFILGHFMNNYVAPRLCKPMLSVSDSNNEDVQRQVYQMIKFNKPDPNIVKRVKMDNIFYVAALAEDKGCLLPSLGFQSLVKYYFSPLSCTLNVPSSPNKCTNKHHLGKLEFPFKVSGFSGAEGPHRWTEGNEAVLNLPLAHGTHRFKSVEFETSALVSEQHSQTVEVYVNGTLFNKVDYTQKQPSQIINVALPDDQDDATIVFKILNPISPAQLTSGKNPDPRMLGLRFGNVELLCWSKRYHLGNPFGFPYTLSGFSGPEFTHRWTENKQCTIDIPLPSNLEDRPTLISFLSTHALVSNKHAQSVNVFLNYDLVDTIEYTDKQNDHQIDVTIPEGFTESVARIMFDIPNPLTVEALTGKKDSDNRLLGIRFGEVLFSYLPRK